jgi:hypothetical protein
MSLVDDPTTRVRARGLRILSKFLDIFPGKILRDTGLYTVFEQAIFPTLLHLPSITPVDESVQLLPAAFEALLQVAQKLLSQGDQGVEKQKLLTKVVREGILAVYSHARDHTRIVNIVAQQVSQVATEMGCETINHLKVSNQTRS